MRTKVLLSGRAGTTPVTLGLAKGTKFDLGQEGRLRALDRALGRELLQVYDERQPYEGGLSLSAPKVRAICVEGVARYLPDRGRPSAVAERGGVVWQS